MNSLIIDAASDKIFLTLIFSNDVYTCSHDNSKSNFEKLIIIIDDFLNENKITIAKIDRIYVNRGPGSFAGIRNSLSTIKAIHLTMKIDYYCYSFQDIQSKEKIKYENIPNLCDKFGVKKKFD